MLNPPSPLKNIIFDLGGVLINLDFKKGHDAFDVIGVADIKSHFRFGVTDSVFEKFETGHVSVGEFTAHIRGLASGAPDDAAIFGAWNALLLDYPPERMAFLESLKKKYRLFLFSNINAVHHARVQEIYREQFPGRGLDDHFDKAYYSHHIGHRKPHVASFAHIIKDAGIEPSETLFIDDLLENTHGAAKAGLRTVHLTPDKTILDLGL